MGRFDELKENLRFVWNEEGPYYTAERLGAHAKEALVSKLPHKEGRTLASDHVDVYFINGCDYSVPHPIRYRVFHQAEQLEAVGISTRIVNAWELNDSYARLARTFVIFRCPHSEFVENFINLVHSLHKTVLFDIDDLVVDTKYTDQIPFLDTLSEAERNLYDDGVRRMGKTMMLCDGVITTTEQLATELKNYLGHVHVNRNVASEEMYYLSDRAVCERDVLPLLAKNEVPLKERHRWKMACERKQGRSGFALGYFSGSISHNPDFAMVLPAVVRFMDEHPDATLHVVGDLDLPADLVRFESRLVRLPFSPWRRLPQMLSFVDVNLIPLEDTIFNRAKSENKWVEAALVKVPSLASNVGALKDSIVDGVTGLLCDTPDQWYEGLCRLYDDRAFARELAERAHEECVNHHLTCGTGTRLARFIAGVQKPNVAVILPSLNVSGGILVALRHALILHEAGYDVTLVGNNIEEDGEWFEFRGVRFPVLSRDVGAFRGRFDKVIGTMWTTIFYVDHFVNTNQRYYLVQGRETSFYEPGDIQRSMASITYGCNHELVYCTISPWCKRWLETDFDKTDVRYAPNGIDLELFTPVERDWSGKIRILIEGDSESPYKNVDESFRIAQSLDPNKYEVWYLAYSGEPKEWYRYERFFKKLPHDEVGDVYRQCHILLKTSVLESFSYPPLEMMATGGQAVVLANEGNAAYLRDGENCLLFDKGEDEKAKQLIEQLVADEPLREQLRAGGLETAAQLDWSALTDQILDLYR